MSSFAELSPQLLLLGTALRTGLILGGTGYLQDLLLPMNLSDAWLGLQLGNLEAIKRQGWLTNGVYALQNLMESFLECKPPTPQLSSIGVPTIILNGEFISLPRARSMRPCALIRAGLAEDRVGKRPPNAGAIMFLKSADLLPLRVAANAAVECRHEQVRKLWDDMLSSIGIDAARNDERRSAQ
jgi:hypothetical protein